METNFLLKKLIGNSRRKLNIGLFFFSLLFLINGICHLQAQSGAAVDYGEALWPDIESQLDQQKSDTAFHFIVQLVRDRCGEDFNCLNNTYAKLIYNIEVKFNLPAAVYLSHEMAIIAKREKNLEEEGLAYMNIHRFYDAMGNEELGAVNVKKAQDVFEEIGNYYMVTIIKMNRLESSLLYRNHEEVIPEMNALIAEIDAAGNGKAIGYVHHRMINICLEAELYEDAKRHVEIIDDFIISDSLRSIDYGYDITVASARAKIAIVEKDLVKAEAFYQTALAICEAAPSRWLEIATLHSLADLEWERGNLNLTKSYLDRAKLKAEELKLDDFLMKNHAFQAKIAEEEGRYANALTHTRQEYFYDEKIKEKNAGFQMRNYHLQLETEQLKTEKEMQDFELALQDNQLQSLSVIIGLGVLLTSLLVFGVFFQRKRKKELAEQNALIQEQAERLASLDIAKSRFFANVSHELRTPLTLLLGPINSALKSGTLNDRNASLLSFAQRSGKDLLKLIGSILDLSKLESGKLKLEEKPEMLFPLIRRITSTFESYADQSGVEFLFEYQGEKDLKLKLDSKKLEIIINNLLSNAMKFTQKKGKITLLVEDLSSNMRLTVADTGRGIHKSDLPHIFNRFYQSEQADAPTEGGTGIGLSLCQDLIKLMGGKIEVESKIGEGSTFRIEFPRKEVLGTRELIEEDLAQTEVFNLIAATNKPDSDLLPTIMIVEDNRSLQEYLKTLLVPFYKVITAENGQKALDKLVDITTQPALILSDVMMPVMDGFQFLKEVKSKENLRHLPVIMLTARVDIQDKLKALRIGVDDYLLKPFEEEELLVRIANLLDNQVRRKEVIVKEKPQKATFTISAKDKIWLEKFEIYVKENLTSHLMTVPNLARHFAMSESSLLRQLKSLTGLSPIKYLQEVRLEKARNLLESGAFESIGKVANEVGYSDARTFSRSYKKRFGKLPSESLQLM